MLGGTTLWAFGTLSFIGFSSGFAHAGDVASLETRLATMQNTQIVRDIREAKQDLCYTQIQSQKNPAALDSANKYLEMLRQEYRMSFSSEVRVPHCPELIAGWNGPND